MTKELLSQAVEWGMEDAGLAAEPTAVKQIVRAIERAFQLSQRAELQQPIPFELSSPPRLNDPPAGAIPHARDAVEITVHEERPAGPDPLAKMAIEPIRPTVDRENRPRLIVTPGEAVQRQAEDTDARKKTKAAYWDPISLLNRIEAVFPREAMVDVPGCEKPVRLVREQFHDPFAEAWKVVLRDPRLEYTSQSGDTVQIMSPEASVIISQLDQQIDFTKAWAKLTAMAEDVFRPRERTIVSKTPFRGETIDQMFARDGLRSAVEVKVKE